MVIKVFVSSTSGNMEMKTKQDFIHQILQVKKIDFEDVDISDPQLEEQKIWMRKNANAKKDQQHALPPQIFNEEQYCGDFDQLHEANEVDSLWDFLKLEAGTPEAKTSPEHNGSKGDGPETDE